MPRSHVDTAHPLARSGSHTAATNPLFIDLFALRGDWYVHIVQEAPPTDRDALRERARAWRKQAVQKAGLKDCECGCGEKIPAVKADGTSPRRFVAGHDGSCCRRVGETRKNDAGYVLEYTGEKWALQHRLVWERANGPIPSGMAVHHINGEKTDNRLENLEVIAPSDHSNRHWRERWEERKPQCADIGHLRQQARGSSSATPEQAVAVRERVAGGETVRAVADDLGLSGPTASRIWSGKTWRCRICNPPPPRPKRPKTPSPGKPSRITRTEVIPLRATPGEKARMKERAAEAGLSLSAWVRRAAMEGVLPAVPKLRPKPAPEDLGPDYELRVRQTALRMPRKTAELLVRREMEKEAA